MTVMTELTARELLVMLYQAAVDAVDGRFLVNQWCRQQLTGPDARRFTHCVAIGKAGAAMLEGALDQISSLEAAILICPPSKINRKLQKDERIRCCGASHPVPDESSLAAAQELIRFLTSLDDTDEVLFLISGGTSALVELPIEGVSLDDLQRINRYLLSSGKDIHQMNAWRQQFSQIKGGGLKHYLKSSATQLLISDVKDDIPAFIGSGLLVYSDAQPDEDSFLAAFPRRDKLADKESIEIDTHIIGNIEVAMQAILDAALAQSLPAVIHHEFLEGEVTQVAKKLYDYLCDAPAGIHIWGGETTVTLPENPGIGGRNQALALTFSRYLADTPDLHLLAAGTDGVDGNSNCAGAVVSMYTTQKANNMGLDIQQALDAANSGMLLMATDDLVRTEESNTNVMDVVIAYKI